MNMHPIISSTISHIGHDANTGEMRIIFKSGKTYHYGNVSAQQFDDFKHAPSAGRHFLTHFKGNAVHAVEVPKQ